MAPPTSIPRAVFQRMILVTAISCGLIGFLWIAQEYRRFQARTSAMRKDQIDARKREIKAKVQAAIDFIQYKRQQTDLRIRQTLRDRVYEAHSIATHLHAQYKDSRSSEEIQAMVREALRPLRFNNGRGYYFATRLDGVEQLFADHPELEGRNLLGMQDTTGAYVIRDMIALVQSQNEGFYSYTWTKPDAEGNAHVKLSFIKRFEPFDWFLGTGEYLEDVEADLQKEALDWIAQMRDGEGGYVFVGRWDGVTLSGPATGRNMMDTVDPNGVRIVQALIERAQGEGGFVEYVMPRIDGQRPAPKISYAQGVKEWKWYVGTGMYMDDIEVEIERLRLRQLADLRWNITGICAVLAALLLGAAVSSRRLARRARAAIDAFSDFLERASTAPEAAPGESMGFAEFDRLAELANRMIARRREAEQERRMAVERLQSSETRFRSIVNSIPMGMHMYQLQEDGRLVFTGFNPAAERILGVDHSSFVGKAIEEAFPSLIGTEVPARYRETARLGTPWRTEHIDYRDKRIAGAFEVYAFQTEPGRMVALFNEITERKRAEEERARLEEQYRQAQKMEAVGQLTGGVAHDFNNLLQVINGYADIAAQDLPPDHPSRDAIAQVAKAGERAARLVSQLLTFSRRQIMRPVDLDLNDTIEDMLKMLRRVIGEHIEIEWMPGNRLGAVHADRGMIEQALMNLCVNARDAMPDGGRLTIETENVRVDPEFCKSHAWARPGRYVLVSVSDTGCGMSDEILEHVFEPFFTTKEIGKGTGLGLATVYGIVKQHDGMVTVYSEPGKGSIFKLYWPQIERPAQAVGAALDAPVAGGHETVLVAEDDPAVLALAQAILEASGYTVLTARNGAEAVNVLRARADQIALAVLDVVMPEMGGREAYDRMQRIRPGLKVVFASGYSENAVHTNFVLDKGLSLLQKPYTRQVLLRAVRAALDA